MFVHRRVVEMINIGILVTVYIPSTHSGEYIYESVSVKKIPSKSIIKEIISYDILYLHLLNIYPFSKADGWLIYKHIMKNDIPFAMYVHGSEVQRYSTRMFEFNYKITDILKWIKKDVFVIPKMKKFLKNTKDKKNATYLFPSNWMRQDMEHNLNTKLNKFSIIPNGIDTNYYGYKNTVENRYKLLTIRSLSQKVYNIEQTIDVMSLLPEKYSLVIYGEGIYRKKYEERIKVLRLEKRIKIMNTFLEKDEMREVYKDYGVFISTTRMDSQGITMMEAMASGLLVVTTNNSSKEEFIHNLETGVVGKNNKELVEGILRLTNDEVLFAKVSKAAREAIEEIDNKKTVRKEVEVLKSLMN